MPESITATVDDSQVSLSGEISFKGLVLAVTAILDMINEEYGISPEDFGWVLQNLREIRKEKGQNA